jgi:transposase
MASNIARAHARTGQNTRNPPPPRPLPQGTVDHAHRYSLAQRVQCLTLLAEGYSGREIQARTGVIASSQTHIKQKARKRGFEPTQDPRILDHYVEDGARSGRPKEITTATELKLLSLVQENRAGREKSAEVLAYECGISYSSALNILHKYGLRNVKPTRKPGLNTYQRAARLAFAIKHKDWTLYDWQRVIWSDETSVILGQRRGAVRLWRRSNEAYESTVIRRR